VAGGRAGAAAGGREGTRIKIEVTIDLSGSMLEAEESILRGVNAVGDAATAEALKRFDADGDPIAIGDSKWYSKGKLPKTYNTPYGIISVERHVYARMESLLHRRLHGLEWTCACPAL
jgi:hypothetical protein